MLTKPQTRCLLVCLLVILLLPGCTGLKSVEMGTTVNADGSGRRVMSFTIDKKMAAAIEKENRIELENELSRRLPAHAVVKTSQKSNSILYTITIAFNKANNVPYPFRKLLKKNGNPNVSLVQKDRIFAVSYDLKEELSLEKDPLGKVLPKPLNIPANSLRIKYWIRLPGEIRESSGTPVTIDKAVWYLEAGRTYKIRAKSLLIRWWLVALTGIALLLLIGLSGVLIINRKDTGEPSS